MVGEIASAYVTLIPSFRGGGSKIASELRGPSDSAGKSLGSRFGQRFSSAATKPLKSIGGVLAGAFAFHELARGATELVHLSSSFQSSMVKIQTMAGASSKDVATLSKQVLALGGKVAQSPTELADSLYHLKSVGLDNARAMDALRASSEFASVGGADLEETTNALAGTWRSGIKGAGSFKQAVATLNAVIGSGNMRMKDLNDAIGTGFLPSARSFGIGLKDVGSALAVLTDEGIPANVAATRLRMSFSLLGAPSDKAAGWLSTIGLKADDLAKKMRSNGLVGALGMLKDHLDRLGNDKNGLTAQATLLSHAFGGGRSSSAILTLINNYAVLQRKEQQIDQTAGLKNFSRSVQANAQTAEQKIARFKSALETLGTEAGKPLMGAVASMLTPLTTDITHLMPKLQALGREVKADLGPAFSAGKKLLGDWAKAAGDAAHGGSLLHDVLKPLGNVLEGLYKAEAAIPSPLKAIAIEGAAAALIWPKIAGGASSVIGVFSSGVGKVKAFTNELSLIRTDAVWQKGLNQLAANGVITTGKLNMTTRATSTFKSALGQMSGALKAAAGVGGMMLLAQSTQQSNKALGLLESTAGGAATGFAVGGPWGAAIGGAAGLVVGLAKSLRGTTSAAKINYAELRKTEAIKVAKDSYAELRDTLNKTTGAYTKNTRAALENWLQTNDDGKKVRAALKLSGVGDRTILGDLLGNPAAQKRVMAAFNTSVNAIDRKVVQLQEKQNNALGGYITPPNGESADKYADQLQRQIDALNGQKAALVKNEGALQGESGALRKASKDTRDFYSATSSIRKQLGETKKTYDKVFSKKVRGELNLDGVPKTLAGIRTVSKNVGGLTRREWKVLLKAAGIDTTAKQLNSLVTTGRKSGKNTGDGYISQMAHALFGGTGKVTSNARGVVQKAGSGASGTAHTAGHGVGSDFAAGIAAGITASTGFVEAAAIAAVNRAEAAARSKKGADTGSPSKKTRRLGRDWGLGLPLGIQDTHPTLRRAAEQAVNQLTLGAGSGARAQTRQRQVAQMISAGTGGRQIAAGPSAADLAAALADVFPDSFTLSVDGYEFTAYVEDVADGRVNAHQRLRATSRRAGSTQ